MAFLFPAFTIPFTSKDLLIYTSVKTESIPPYTLLHILWREYIDWKTFYQFY